MQIIKDMKFSIFFIIYLSCFSYSTLLSGQNLSQNKDTVEVIRLNNLFKTQRSQNPLEAYMYTKKALDLSIELNYARGKATSFNNLGVYHRQKGDYDRALDFYQKALIIYDSIIDMEGTAKALSNIGNIYSVNSDYENALAYYLRAQLLFEEINQPYRTMQIMNNIGNVYLENGQELIALDYYLKVLNRYNELANSQAPLDPYSNIGKIYFNREQYDSALYYFSKSLKKEEAAANKFGIASALVKIARLQNVRGNYDEALEASTKAAKIAERVDSKPILMESYATLAEVYLMQDNLRSSYLYMNQYHLIKDSLFNESSRRAIAQLEKNIELEQKEKEISLLRKEAEITNLQYKNSQLYNYGSIVLTLLISALALVLYSRFKQSRRAKFLLTHQNNQILKSKRILEIQKQKLESWNKNITDSIEYAKSIQDGIMSKNIFQQNIEKSFVLFKPKDIVSGDFYWYTRKEGYDIIAMIDCTGHGVAGAFMTVIANAAMNHVVNEKGTNNPSEILNLMDLKVMETLKQKEVTTKNHSMDIALCKIDYTNKKVVFAGARRPLYIIEHGALTEIKGSKFTIGEYFNTPQKEFCCTEIPIKTGQTFYMTSDGYPDQFGFETQKKYMTKRFKNLLVTVTDKSMLEQHKSLNLEMQRWQGAMEQTDDMLVIGFSLS